MSTRNSHLAALLMLTIAAVLIGCSSDETTDKITGPRYLATDFFVSVTSGNDANTGGIGAPFATIQRAIDTAGLAGGRVFVAEGTYNESLNLDSKVGLFGGYKNGTFTRDLANAVTTINGGPMAVRVGDADSVSIDGFTIRSADAVAAGGSSIAISLHNATGIVITNNQIQAGKGAAGPNRSKPGTPAKSPDGSPGADATNAGCDLISCVSTQGGNGGFQTGMSGGNGGDGCSVKCDDGGNGEGPGGDGGASRGVLGGAGGNGGAGGQGSAVGVNGTGGSSFGSIGSGLYMASSGTNGQAGSNGGGGGGGGGGGAALAKGASGGGGGAGGLGGLGGFGGGGGGGSIGILLTGTSLATIQNNTITTSNGGAGGSGAPGGDPGTPGLGASGRAGN
ncbi:MAG: hypothetical protein AB1772_12615, partial [Candidatus Zixiibacteriota bacterium]